MNINQKKTITTIIVAILVAVMIIGMVLPGVITIIR